MAFVDEATDRDVAGSDKINCESNHCESLGTIFLFRFDNFHRFHSCLQFLMWTEFYYPAVMNPYTPSNINRPFEIWTF